MINYMGNLPGAGALSRGASIDAGISASVEDYKATKRPDWELDQDQARTFDPIG